jgi:hypothetical protein
MGQEAAPNGEACDKLGRPLSEAARINALTARGYRYKNFGWHDPDGLPCGTNDWRLLPVP